jgi:phospholipase/lecithinase/hemolysin
LTLSPVCNLFQHSLKYVVKCSRRCANQEEDIMKARMALVGAFALVAVAAVSVQTAPRAPFDRIVVFGASLSDSGNAFALRGGTNTPPDYQMDPLFVPAVPYARGGHHFSNGATWVEQYARSIGLAGSARPAFESAGRGTNYAVAAARGWEDGLNFNLSAQVDAFLQDSGGVAPPDALYTIEIGGNDIRDALLAFPSGSGLILGQAITSIRDNIGRLYAAGARNFLVWRAPDVGLTPALGILDRVHPGSKFLASSLTQGFNSNLDNLVSFLTLSPMSPVPGIRIARLDAYKLLHDIVNDPVAYGLTDVTSPCVTPNVAPFTCQTPDEFLFWDGIHPTKAVHAIIAQEAASALSR